VWSAITESGVASPNIDTLADFQTYTATTVNGDIVISGDKINLSAIDANTDLDGNQDWIIGDEGFPGYGAGEIEIGNGWIKLYQNNDAVADMIINIQNNSVNVTVTANDFIL
jgi:hypothetical protein